MRKRDRKQLADAPIKSRYPDLFGLRIVSVLLVLLMFFVGINLLPGTSRSVSAEQNKESQFAASSFLLSAQGGKALRNKLWRPTNDALIQNQTFEKTLPQAYATKALNQSALAELLSQAPMEFTAEAESKRVIMALPMPDGSLAEFRIEESPIM